METFPIVQQSAAPRQALPLAREVAWDYHLERPIYTGGEPVIVEGAEAVKVWCWRALRVARRRWPIYTWDYGCEAEALIGRPFDAQVKESEAIRYVREALAPNPYVTGVRQIQVTFEGTTLTLAAQVETIYGEVILNV